MNKFREVFELLLVLALVVACHATRYSNQSILPGNTVPDMLKAIDLGVTALKIDVAPAEDKQAILFHDPFFNYRNTTLEDSKKKMR